MFYFVRKYSYPSQIENKTGIRVINAGINGELSGDGLKRLPHILKDIRLELVILCHGANDILNRLSSDQMKQNILNMIKLIKQNNAEVLLVGVPNYYDKNLNIQKVYKEIAKETNVLLEDNVLREIALDKSCQSDYVHPNEKGYEMIVDRFIEVLKLNTK